MGSSQPDKWNPLIDQINHTEELSQKVNLLATMVRMIATNELSCMDARIAELTRKLYLFGFIIIALVFTDIDIKMVLDLIIKIIK